MRKKKIDPLTKILGHFCTPESQKCDCPPPDGRLDNEKKNMSMGRGGWCRGEKSSIFLVGKVILCRCLWEAAMGDCHGPTFTKILVTLVNFR